MSKSSISAWRPRQRLGDIRDARLEIEEALMEPPAAVMTEVTPARNAHMAWIMAALMTLAFLWIAVVQLRDTPPPLPPEMRLEISTPPTSSFALSPDGRRFVFLVEGTTQQQGLYLASLDGGGTKRLGPADISAVYVPSGFLLFMREDALIAQRFELESGTLAGDPVIIAESVAFAEDTRAGGFSASDTGLVAYRTASGQSRQLTWFDRTGKAIGVIGGPDENDLNGPALSPDGRWVAATRTFHGNSGRFFLYSRSDSRTRADLEVLPLIGERKPFPFVKGDFDEAIGRFSPDGRWVAYRSNETGRNEVYVQPFPGPGGKLQVSTNGGTQPRWRSDGKELFYLAPDAKLVAVPVRVSGSTFEAGVPIALFQTRISGGYAVAADGRILINTRVGEAAVSPITLLLNWRPPAR